MRSSPSRRIDGASASGPAPGRLAALGALPFAHRGLHGPGRLENSRAAFEAALARGHGIELDVQASADGHAFVFHDGDLSRLTDETGPVAARLSDELKRIRLSGTDETVPLLAEILRLIASRAPLLIELKTPDREVAQLCLAVFRALEGYCGPVGVMSFNPEVGRWFARHAPRVVRGLVVSESDRPGWRGRIERRIALWRSKPHFLAYDVRDLPSRFAASARARGLSVFTWTVRTGKQARTAEAHADQVIYETVR